MNHELTIFSDLPSQGDPVNFNNDDFQVAEGPDGAESLCRRVSSRLDPRY